MRTKLVIKSGIIGIFAQMITVFFTMFSMRFFVQELGLEIKGINGLLTNVLGMLQLAELGIGTAITFALYQPIVEKNENEIRALMHLFKRIYFFIGMAIALIGAFLSFFIDVFIVDASIAKDKILEAYFLFLLITTSSYFLGAYKRNLLYADQKQYIYTLTDTITNIIFSIIKIAVIIIYKSYNLYLLVQLLQTVTTNIVISYIVNKEYPFLFVRPYGEYNKKEKLFTNLKHIAIGKIGGFVYSSTDNLIISRFVGIIQVGYMSSYYEIVSVVNVLVSSITAPIQPIIGNYIRENESKEEQYQLFLTYTFGRYVIANAVSVGFVSLISIFVEIWLGKVYVLPISIPILMMLDLYIGIIHGPTGEFVAVLGLFKDDRNMSLMGMLINLILSIVCVKVFGVEGVLIGTAFTQMYYWIARAYIVFRQYFIKGVWRYIKNVFLYSIVLLAEVLITIFFLQNISFVNIYMQFVLALINCIVLSLGINFLLFRKSKEFKHLLNLARGMVK